MRPEPEAREHGARRTAAVILAAGQASRMGVAKTLLAFNGEALVRRAARAALEAHYDQVSVVVADDIAAVSTALDGLPVTLIVNRQARDGIGTSIAAGVRALGPDIERVALVLSDQPFITSTYLSLLLARAMASPCQVVASRYADTFGVPALFSRTVFPQLAQLSADQGCKGIIRSLAEEAVFLDCPEALVDVDTPEDYVRLTAAR